MGVSLTLSQHFIGNRAIDIASGQTELQIAYSSGFTALSFFVPILVLLTAFMAVGANNTVSWWRVAVGGSLAGAAICGMHYLGNASISNYVCVYNLANVVGSAIIAVAASIVALALFFVFRAAWTNSWWKRGLCAVVLAGAVSGMHWCASTGTNYRLVSLNPGSDELSRNTTVIIVICLSVGACFVMAGTAVYTTRIMKRYASKAQQVVLAAAIFDAHGRVLVSPDGLLPSEKITETFLEKTPQDSFTTAHPLFHWMFQASRNWGSIGNMMAGIASHLGRLPRAGRDGGRGGIQLITEHGELIDHYDVVFRELFCVAAQSLADQIKTPLGQVGFLWDQILPTGRGGEILHRQKEIDQILGSELSPTKAEKELDGDSDSDSAEKGQGRPRVQEYGRGSLMFLVRRVEQPRDVEALEAAGYRFADPRQVAGIISTSMQIKSRNVVGKLHDMQRYAEQEGLALEPGVHLGLFAVRARVGSFGFDVLVRKVSRNLLPSVKLPMDSLDQSQINLLTRLDRLNPPQTARRLEHLQKSTMTPKEKFLASQMVEAISELRGTISDPVFDDSIINVKVVQVPCRRPPQSSSSAASMATMITFRLVIPIHTNVTSLSCDFVPLSFFKVHQLVQEDSPHKLIFSRSVHRELGPVINAKSQSQPEVTVQRVHHRRKDSHKPSRLRRIARSDSTRVYGELGSEGGAEFPKHLAKTGSMTELWNGARNSGETTNNPSMDTGFEAQRAAAPAARLSPSASTTQISSFGGIMVSQEITINVDHAKADEPPTPTARRLPTRDGSSNQDSESVAGISDSAGTVIEMTNLQNVGQLSMGGGRIVTNATAEGDTQTFVDTLFALCAGGT